MLERRQEWILLNLDLKLRQQQNLKEEIESMKSPLSCEQQKAILALLETMGRLAPQLSVLRMDGTLLQPIPPFYDAAREISILGLRALDLSQTFRALRHLTIDVWAHGNDLQMLQGLTSLEVLRVNATRPNFEPQCDLDLPFLTGLTQFHFSGVAPLGLRLPASCQCTLVNTGPCAVLAPLQALLPAITPWLVSLEVTLSESLGSVVKQDLFKLDVHLEHLTIECGNFATQESPLVAGDSCLLLTQAKHVELLCSSAYLQIPADAQLAWSLIRVLGRGQVWVSAEAPEVFLSRCSFVQVSFNVSNLLAEGVLAWRSAAEALGLKAAIISRTVSDRSRQGEHIVTFCRPGVVFTCSQTSFCACHACESTWPYCSTLPF